MDTATTTNRRVTPWNKGKLFGQKPPLKLKEIWAIRIRLQLDHRARELALFNLAIEAGAVPFSQPSVGVAASFDATVFADRRVVGRVNRTGPGGLRTHSLRRTKPTLIYRRTR